MSDVKEHDYRNHIFTSMFRDGYYRVTDFENCEGIDWEYEDIYGALVVVDGNPFHDTKTLLHFVFNGIYVEAVSLQEFRGRGFVRLLEVDNPVILPYAS